MNYYRQRGLTLIELMTVIVILAVVTGLAAPSMQVFTERNERRAALYDLYHGLQLARAEAVGRGVLVTVCPLDGNNDCNDDWNGTVHIFQDSQNQRTLTSEQNLIRVIPPTTRGTREARLGNRHYFQFKPDGMVRGTMGNITYCPASGDIRNAGQLIINLGGRTRYARDINNDGVVQQSDGSPVSCG